MPIWFQEHVCTFEWVRHIVPLTEAWLMFDKLNWCLISFKFCTQTCRSYWEKVACNHQYTLFNPIQVATVVIRILFVLVSHKSSNCAEQSEDCKRESNFNSILAPQTRPGRCIIDSQKCFPNHCSYHVISSFSVYFLLFSIYFTITILHK